MKARQGRFSPLRTYVLLLALLALPVMGYQGLKLAPAGVQAQNGSDARTINQMAKRLSLLTKKSLKRSGRELTLQVVAAGSRVPESELLARSEELAEIAPAAVAASVTGRGLDEVMSAVASGTTIGDYLSASGADHYDSLKAFYNAIRRMADTDDDQMPDLLGEKERIKARANGSGSAGTGDREGRGDDDDDDDDDNRNGNRYDNGNRNNNANDDSGQRIKIKGDVASFPPELVGTWVINGRSVIVTSSTRIKGRDDLRAGARAKVKGSLLSNGFVLASRIDVRD